jgi:general secretion pathway protein H
MGARAAGVARQRGLSLIELLVVMAVIGAVIAGVTLSLVGSGARELENTARRTLALLQLACERAELTGVDIGWRLDAEGLRFGPLRETGWEPLGADLGDELRRRDWPPGTALALWREGEPLDPAADPAQPQLACLASGELSPFVLELRREGVAGGWRLRGELLGTLALEPLEPLDAP